MNVAATMGITVDEINKGDKSFQMLEKAALDMGKATQFSASDATEALNYLALAGYDAEKAVETLPKVLNLAAAGGLELGHASELVTQSMNALGLGTDQLEGFVDQLAVTAQSSGTNVAQLGEAILAVGGTAKNLAGGTVELNTQLGILADVGLQGSEGGIKLRNVLMALGDTSGKTADGLKELGISAYDSNGELRHTDDIFQDMNKSMDGWSDEKKANLLGKMFNKQDIGAVNALLAGSGDRFEELSTKIEKSEGAAEEMAATMNDNLLGKIELLKSAMEYLGIVIYKSVDSPLRDVVETFTGYIDKISGVLTAHDDARASMEELGYSATQIEEELKGIPNGLEGAAVVMGEILADMVLKLAENAPKFLEMGVNLVTALLDGLRESLPQIAESAVDLIQGFAMSYLQMLPQVIVLGIELITNLIQGIAEMLPELIPIGIEAINTIFDALMENLPLIIDAGIDIIVALVDGIVEMLPELITMSIDLIILIADKLIENIDLIIDAGIQILMAVIQGIMDNLPKLIAEVPRIINAFADAIYSNLPTILKSAIGIMLEIIKGLIQSIPTLVANIPQIIMAIVNVFTLYNWWNLGKSVITKLGTGIKSMVGNIGNIAKGLATNVINAIKGIFTQAPSVGSGFIRGIMNGISSLVSSLISLGGTMARNALTAIKTAFSSAPSLGSDMVKGIWNGINNVTGWILSKIKGFGNSIVSGIKDIFKIKSPSRVMKDEVGVMIGRGLAEGIDKSTGEATKSTKKMGKSVLDIAQSIDKNLIKQTNENSKTRLRLVEDNSKKLLEVAGKHLEEQQKLGKISLKDEVEYWHEMSKYVGYGTEEYAKMLENRQKAVETISNEIVKINEDYTKKMIDLDKKLVEETKKLNEEYSQAYEKRVSDLVGVGGLFDEFVANDRIAGDELISNMESQVVALAQYEGYIGILGERIGNADLMGELKGLGPKAVGELESLVSLSDEQLAEYVNLYEVKFKMATRQAEKELEPMKKNTEKQIQDLNKAAQTELDVLQSDWTKSIQKLVSGTEKELDSLKGVGANAIKGLEEGMLSMEDGLMATANRIANSIRSTIQSALQINSPSRLMRDEVGKNIIRGIGVGLEDEMPSLQRDINKEMSKLTHKMKSTVEFETSSSARAMTGSSGYSRGSETVTNNSDNGVVQNVTIVSPENTPSENARALRKVGRDLALGY